MIPLHMYPYTNFSEMNLDYLLKSVHELDAEVNGLKLKIDTRYIYLLDKDGNTLSKVLYPDKDGVFSFKAYTTEDTGTIFDMDVDDHITVECDLTSTMDNSIFDSGKVIIQVEHYYPDVESHPLHFCGFIQHVNSKNIFTFYDAVNTVWKGFEVFYNNVTGKLGITRVY